MQCHPLPTDIPCVITSPADCKKTLKLLRKAGWHRQHYARLVLNKRDPRTSYRAFQVTPFAVRVLASQLRAADTTEHDESVAALESHLDFTGAQNADTVPAVTDAVAELLKLLQDGTIRFRSDVQLQFYIIHGDTDTESYTHDAPPDAVQVARKVTTLKCGIDRVYKTPIPVERPRKPPKFRFSELFSGIGGFRVALEALGGQCVMASEINPHARHLYQANFGATDEEYLLAGGAAVLRDGVQLIDGDSVPAHDIMTLGFPCQPFTSSGDCRAFADPRAQLLWQALRLAKACRPSVLLLENVKGLLSNGPTFQTVLSEISALGYAVDFRVYNSQVLVPQDRDRVYIVAFRQDLASAEGFEFCWPDMSALDHTVTLGDIIEPSAPQGYTLTQKQWSLVSNTNYFKKNPTLRLPPMEGIANTLRATYRSGFRLYSQFVGDVESVQLPRFFTPRECARLQGFPDWFELGDDLDPHDQSVYHSLGNAVSPPIIHTLAQAILQSIGVDH